MNIYRMTYSRPCVHTVFCCKLDVNVLLPNSGGFFFQFPTELYRAFSQCAKNINFKHCKKIFINPTGAGRKHSRGEEKFAEFICF